MPRTPRTAEQVEELVKRYSNCSQARKDGYSVGQYRFNRVRGELARQGVVPEWGLRDQYPQGLAMKKVTVHKRHVDGIGEVVNTWERACEDTSDLLQRMEATAQAFLKDVPAVPVRPYTRTNPDTDIIPWIQIGDGHLGMLARKSEVGHDYNLDIAEQELCVAVATILDRLPDCERAVIQDCGDLTHYENLAGVTEGSGHRLDVDGRGFGAMLDVYVRVMRFIVERALEKFRYVDVIINQGNHSRKNDFWMPRLLRAAYRDCDRLHVLDNDGVFIPYRMGNTFVLCTHTDQCKPGPAAAVMADKYKQDWGETRYHYLDGGHVHHKNGVKELNGVWYESWNQLAPSDKYAHDNGYGARKCLTAVLRSKTYGEKGREVLTREEVQDILDNAAPGTAAQHRQAVYSV